MVLETPLSLTSGDMPGKIMFVCYANNTFDAKRRRLLMLKIQREASRVFMCAQNKAMGETRQCFQLFAFGDAFSSGFLKSLFFVEQEHTGRTSRAKTE
jgi:hypothetical protein